MGLGKSWDAVCLGKKEKEWSLGEKSEEKRKGLIRIFLVNFVKILIGGKHRGECWGKKEINGE